MSEKYNYLEQVTSDAKEAILERMDEWNFSDRDELEDEGKISYPAAEK